MSSLNSVSFITPARTSFCPLCNTSSYQNPFETKMKGVNNVVNKIIDNHIAPVHGKNLSIEVYLGNFTSPEYGSHQILFYNNKKMQVAKIIADAIMGEYKYEVKNL